MKCGICQGRKTIGSKCVFKTKKAAHGGIEGYV